MKDIQIQFHYKPQRLDGGGPTSEVGVSNRRWQSGDHTGTPPPGIPTPNLTPAMLYVGDVVDTHNVLFDVLADDTATADLYFNRLRQNPPSERLHLTRECRREHDCLPVWTDVVNHSHHLNTTKKLCTAAAILLLHLTTLP